MAVFLQLILGAAFRHKAFGIIPHLIGAVIVTILIFMTAGALKRRFAKCPGAAKLRAGYLHILIGVQLLLGAGAYWSRLYGAQFPQPIAVMVALTVVHTVTGALVLAATLVTALISYRMVGGSKARRRIACGPRSRSRNEKFDGEQRKRACSSEASRPALYLALTKPDVSFLVVMTTVAGYALGTRGPLDWLRMAHTVFGTTLIAAGTSALNHYFERDTDALMRRTASRPLPSGQLNPREAFWFGVSLIVAFGTLYLALATNALATFLGIADLGCCIFAPTRR